MLVLINKSNKNFLIKSFNEKFIFNILKFNTFFFSFFFFKYKKNLSNPCSYLFINFKNFNSKFYFKLEHNYFFNKQYSTSLTVKSMYNKLLTADNQKNNLNNLQDSSFSYKNLKFFKLSLVFFFKLVNLKINNFFNDLKFNFFFFFFLILFIFFFFFFFFLHKIKNLKKKKKKSIKKRLKKQFYSSIKIY